MALWKRVKFDSATGGGPDRDADRNADRDADRDANRNPDAENGKGCEDAKLFVAVVY